MGRCTVIRWALAVALLFLEGCATSRIFDPFGWKRDPDQTESASAPGSDKRNPFKKSDPVASDDGASTSDEERTSGNGVPSTRSGGGNVAKGSSNAKLAALDPGLRKMIQDELKYEPPREREKLLEEWLKFEPTFIKELVASHRAARTLAESREKQSNDSAMADQASAPGGIRLASGSSGNNGGSAASALGTANPWGDSNAVPIPTTARSTTSPVGQGSAFSGPFDTDNNRGPISRPIAKPPQIPADGGSQSFNVAGNAKTPTEKSQSSAANTSPDAFADISSDGTSPDSFSPARSPANSVAKSDGPTIQPAAATATKIQTSPSPGSASLSPSDSSQPVQLGGPLDVPPASGTAQTASASSKSSGGATSSSSLAGLAGRLVGAITPGSNASAARTPAPPGDWHDELQKLVALAAADAAQTSAGTTDAEKLAYTEKQVYLNMLYIISGQPARSMQPIPGLDAPDQEFWQQVFWGVSNYFDRSAIADPSNRATETITQFRAAIRHLQVKSKLELKNVVFCHKITNYGNYERFKRDEFTAGQPVLLYAEVENFKSDPTPEGPYRTLLKSTIEIFDSRQNLVRTMPFPSEPDVCINQRRDYYNSYEFVIPEKIGLGPHTLKLTVEDQISQKIATYTVNFTVK